MQTEIKMEEKHVVPTNNDSGKLRFRKIPPAHYTLKIESFSSLLESKIEKYETDDFEVGSSKWKLVIYPNGKNKLGDNSGHISLFLALAEPKDRSLGWEVNVVASFFVYDQIRDRYLVVENDADEKEWRFHKFKTDWSFNSLLSHEALKDPSSGYLVHDCFTLGVELLVIKNNLQGESLSLLKKPTNSLFTWKITGYLGLSGNTRYFKVITVERNKCRYVYASKFRKLLLCSKGDSRRGVASNLMQTEIKMEEKHVVPTNNDSGKLRFRKIPPAHYTLKIESFSSLLESKMEKYETFVFEVGSSKWKLVIYPNGKNKLGDNSGHISLFLALAEPKDRSLGWEVNVVASFFVYDQIRDRYLVVENDADEKEWRFHKFKTDWGFNSLLSHKALKDPSSGYLVHDCCTLGVELLVIKSNLKGENLSLVKEPTNGLFTWKINRYSDLSGNTHYSEVITVEGNKWKLLLYPKGDSSSKSGYLSLYLVPDSSQTIPPKKNVFLTFTLRVRDQINSKHFEKKAENWSRDWWGYTNFMSRDDLKNVSKGYLVNDQVIIEVEFHVISTLKAFG